MEFLFYTSVERLALLWNRESFLTKNDDILQQYKPHRWWSCRFNFHDKHWTAKTFSPFRLNVTCVSSHHFFGNNMSPRKKFGRNQYMYQLYARYHIDYKISARSFFSSFGWFLNKFFGHCVFWLLCSTSIAKKRKNANAFSEWNKRDRAKSWWQQVLCTHIFY